MLSILLSTLMTSQAVPEINFEEVFNQHYFSPKTTIEINAPQDLRFQELNGKFKKRHSASFVQSILAKEYQLFIEGEAWDITKRKSNKPFFLDSLWSVPEYDFNRTKMLTLHSADRHIHHVKSLYETLDENYQQTPGLLGVTLKFSPHREYVASNRSFLAQTDVCILRGIKEYPLYNQSRNIRTVGEIFTEQFGQPRNNELTFLSERLGFSHQVGPMEIHWYSDYHVECGFTPSGDKSLLQLFFMQDIKHGNSRLVRPVSYTPLNPKALNPIFHPSQPPSIPSQTQQPLKEFSTTEIITPANTHSNQNIETKLVYNNELGDIQQMIELKIQELQKLQQLLEQTIQDNNSEAVGRTDKNFEN